MVFWDNVHNLKKGWERNIVPDSPCSFLSKPPQQQPQTEIQVTNYTVIFNNCSVQKQDSSKITIIRDL